MACKYTYKGITYNSKEEFINQVINPQFLRKSNSIKTSDDKFIYSLENGIVNVEPNLNNINNLKNQIEEKYNNYLNNIDNIINSPDNLDKDIKNLLSNSSITFNKKLNSYAKINVEGEDLDLGYDFKKDTFDLIENNIGFKKISDKIVKDILISNLKSEKAQKLKFYDAWKSEEGLQRRKRELQYSIDTYEFTNQPFNVPKELIPNKKGFIIYELGKGALQSIPGSQGAISGIAYMKGQLLPNKDKNGDNIPDAYLLIDRIDNTGVYIRYITTKKELRQQGIANSLIEKVRKEYPSLPIHRTMIHNPIIVKQSLKYGNITDSKGRSIPNFKNDEEIKQWLEKNDEIIIPSLNNQNPQPDRNPKTRRILEIQSDLFQKWRNNFEFKGNKYTAKKDDKNVWHYYKNESEINANEYTKIWDTFLETYSDNADAFTKLLQKDNNWVTFFVKSIIQDTAKQTITEIQQEDVEAKVRELEKNGLLKIKCD